MFGGRRDQELGLGCEVSEAVHIFKQRSQVGKGAIRLPPGAVFGSSRWELGRSQHRGDLHPQDGRGHSGMTVAGKAAATLKSEAWRFAEISTQAEEEELGRSLERVCRVGRGNCGNQGKERFHKTEYAEPCHRC